MDYCCCNNIVIFFFLPYTEFVSKCNDIALSEEQKKMMNLIFCDYSDFLFEEKFKRKLIEKSVL